VLFDEGEGKTDVEWVVLVGVGRAFARLKRDHQIGPAGRTTQLVRLDEISTEYARQQPLKLHVNACMVIRARQSRLQTRKLTLEVAATTLATFSCDLYNCDPPT